MILPLKGPPRFRPLFQPLPGVYPFRVAVGGISAQITKGRGPYIVYEPPGPLFTPLPEQSNHHEFSVV